MLDSTQQASDVRHLTVADLPWMMSLAYSRYGPYDPGRALTYLLNVLQDQFALCIRSAESFLIASRVVPLWGTPPECHIVFLCAAPGAHWQAITLLRQSVAWARDNGCCKWWFGSETRFDVRSLAKRVGAQEAWPRYKLDL